jgi:hypothetical protein
MEVPLWFSAQGDFLWIVPQIRFYESHYSPRLHLVQCCGNRTYRNKFLTQSSVWRMKFGMKYELNYHTLSILLELDYDGPVCWMCSLVSTFLSEITKILNKCSFMTWMAIPSTDIHWNGTYDYYSRMWSSLKINRRFGDTFYFILFGTWFLYISLRGLVFNLEDRRVIFLRSDRTVQLYIQEITSLYN